MTSPHTVWKCAVLPCLPLLQYSSMLQDFFSLSDGWRQTLWILWYRCFSPLSRSPIRSPVELAFPSLSVIYSFLLCLCIFVIASMLVFPISLLNIRFLFSLISTFVFLLLHPILRLLLNLTHAPIYWRRRLAKGEMWKERDCILKLKGYRVGKDGKEGENQVGNNERI